MKNKNIIFLLIGCMIMIVVSMIIAVTFITKIETKINKLEYIVDNTNLESNIAIMVQDQDTKEYLKTNAIPIGRYKLNESKTKCAGRGVVSNYDSSAGTIKFETEAADECYLYFDQLPEITGAFDEILANYTGQGMTVGGGVLYLHDSTLANGANDGSYRYAGADPDNYLCFEGDTCDDNHKYRIIGIFGENIKVIKMTPGVQQFWNGSNVNTWENSTMDTYLNNEWLTSFGHGDLIEEYEWHVGGMADADIKGSNNVKHTLDAEMASTPTVNRKVGLMYASDYGYAAENTYWSKDLFDYEPSKGHDWMLTSASNEWTISRYSGNSNGAFNVCSTGYVGNYNGSNVTYSYASRPSFYLKSSVEIKSGSGSKTDPWIMG